MGGPLDEVPPLLPPPPKIALFTAALRLPPGNIESLAVAVFNPAAIQSPAADYFSAPAAMLTAFCIVLVRLCLLLVALLADETLLPKYGLLERTLLCSWSAADRARCRPLRNPRPATSASCPPIALIGLPLSLGISWIAVEVAVYCFLLLRHNVAARL